MSPAAEELTGYHLQDVMFRAVTPLFFPAAELEEQMQEVNEASGENLSPFNSLVFRARCTGYDSRTYTLITRRGDLRNVNLTVVPKEVSQHQEPGYLFLLTALSGKCGGRAELQEHQQFAAAIARATPDMLYIYDLQQRKTMYANRHLYKALGYSQRDAAATGEEFLEEVVHPEDWDHVLRYVRSFWKVTDTETRTMECRVRHKDGHYVWIQTRDVIFSRTTEGYPRQILGLVTDIHRQKEAQQELVKSEQRFRILTSNAPVGIFQTDEEGRFTFVNECWCEMTGKTEEETLGQEWMQVLQVKQEKRVLLVWRHMKEQGKKWQHELAIERPDGGQLWMSIHMTPLRDQHGHVIGCLGTAADITERKKTELDLKRHREQLIHAQTIARLGNFTIDYTSNRHSFSKGFFRIVKVEDPEEQEQFCRSYLKFLSYIHPDDFPLVKQIFRRNFHARTSFHMENRIITKAGEVLHVQTRVEAEKDQQGRLMRLYGTMQDVTEQKQKEQELMQAKQQAEDLAKTKEDFLSNMSHEIRTPLNAVNGMTHLLMQENPRKDQMDYLNTLKFSAENLLVLINDILDFSKIEAGKIAFESIDFSLRNLAENIKQSLEYKLEEKDVQIKTVISPEVPEVLIGDPVRLGQILNNLIGNAIKFTDKGHVQVQVEVEKLSSEDVQLHFSVSDTGIGIPEDKLDSIFESFTQASTETTRRYGGTGLGLAITQRLLELMESQIQVESKVGVGSDFSFSLKLKRSASLKVENNGNETGVVSYASLEQHNYQVLVVEDNRINQMVARKFLHKWGLSTTFADNGKMALERMEDQRFDLILMDLQMPEMDGYETTRQIRGMSDNYFKQVPIVALTASAMSDVCDHVLEIGMNDYISKPFVPADLYTKVSRYLKGRVAEEPPPPPPSNAIIDFARIRDFSGGDGEFENTFSETLITQFEEVKRTFADAMDKRKPSLLRALIHKMRTTITLLELQVLEEKLESGKRLIEFKGPKRKLIRKAVSEMDELCDQMIEELSKQLE